MSTMDPREKAKADRAATDRAINAIAKKEFMEYARRPWILVLAGVFVLLTVGGSYVASLARGDSGQVAGFVATLAIMRQTVGLIIPIMAIILAYSALAGEQESGSLGLLLTQPVSRAEVIVGKFVGLFGVLAAAITSGFVLSFLVILLRGAPAEWGDFGRFLIATLLYTAAYFALFLLLSTLASRRNPALLYSLGVWVFLSLIFDVLLTVFLVKSVGSANLGSGNFTLPTWYVVAQFVSIPDLYTLLMEASSASMRQAIGSGRIPLVEDRWGPAYFTVALLAWALGALAVANVAMRRKDV